MNLWKTLPQYPSKEDIIYELSVYLLKDGRPNGEFTFQTFNSAFGSGWQETKHGSQIETIIKDGDFVEVGVYSGNKKYKFKEIPRYSE